MNLLSIRKLNRKQKLLIILRVFLSKINDYFKKYFFKRKILGKSKKIIVFIKLIFLLHFSKFN